ncbi:MAG: CAP domain-containing protein [Ilumatobacteraceae bacterium]
MTLRRLLAATAVLVGSGAVAGQGVDANSSVATVPITAPAQVGVAPALRLWTPCVDGINAARAGAGAAPLTIDTRLAKAASEHSADQARQQRLSHVGPDGTNAGSRLATVGYRWTTWGENVAAGQADCDTVVAAWLASSAHRANILNSAFQHVGVGLVLGENGVPYWTMDLAAGG